VIDSTHWSNSSHNTGGLASPVTCFGNGANGCHGSGHGSEKQWLLAPYTVPVTDPADRSEEREEFCFECHSSTGMSTLDIQADFAGSAITGLTELIAPINNRHDVMPVDQSRSAALVTCKNCHQQHMNTDAEPVADPDFETSLPDYLTSNSYAKSGNNGASGPFDFVYDSGSNLDPTNPEQATGGPYTEPDYIQFCLTCHDGNTPGGVTMTSNMVNIAESYADEQHGLGEGCCREGKGTLKPPWGVVNSNHSAPYAALNCTTCHGAHGTGNIFNLRTSITVAGTVMEVGGQPGSGFDDISGPTYTLPSPQTTLKWGAWCTFCHDLSGHTSYDETTTCNNGHLHGGGNF
jgi:cytochrome c553